MRIAPLAIVALAACDPFVVSQITLTASPSASTDSVRHDATRIVDSLASLHGLASAPWAYGCSIGRAEGTREGSWSAGSLWLTVCAVTLQPAQLQVYMKLPGVHWNAKGDSLRRELPAVLRARFGADAVAVDR